ncbi:MAG: hypothetical protein E6K85_10105 [Thaumarchaeota archaeon]|nr:MAG: hypothetical protein E6K85_10105 [Nitrososphaerota archaeon]
MRKRGILEIVACMLECLHQEPLIKTHLIYKAGIDTRTATKYLSFLTQFNFIEKPRDENSLFVITQRGREFFMIYQSLLRTFGAAQTMDLDIKVSPKA